jgi:hypothetical protein
VVLKSDRLDVRDRTLPMALLDQASQMGLRTLALSDAAGGSGADHLTCCLVAEELAACDADFAAVLTETAWLAHLLFDQAMTDAQREKFLPKFLDDHRCHLAFAGYEASVDTRLGVNYHRPAKACRADRDRRKAASGDGSSTAPRLRRQRAITGLLRCWCGPGRPGGRRAKAGTPGVACARMTSRGHPAAHSTVTFEDCRCRRKPAPGRRGLPL